MEHKISKDIGLYGFADDHAIKNEFTPAKVDDESQRISSLKQCLINIRHGWTATY